MTEKYCIKCGCLIERTWNNYTHRKHCLWHQPSNKDRHFYSPKRYSPRVTKKTKKIDMTIDIISAECDRIERASRGDMRQLWLQEYIERHR
jgi:hypothetical protein